MKHNAPFEVRLVFEEEAEIIVGAQVRKRVVHFLEMPDTAGLLSAEIQQATRAVRAPRARDAARIVVQERLVYNRRIRRMIIENDEIRSATMGECPDEIAHQLVADIIRGYDALD